MRDPGESSIGRRAARLVWRSWRAHPLPHLAAIMGANLFAAAAVAFTIVLGRVTDEVIIPAFEPGGVSGNRVWVALAVVIAVGAVRAVGVMVRRFFLSMAEFRTQKTWRTQVTDQYLDLPLAYHQSHATGELLAHADNDIDMATSMLKPLAFTVAMISLLAFSLVSLALVSWWMVLVAVLLFPTLGVLSRIYTARVAGPAAAVQARVGEVSAIAHESFDGALVVKTLGREQAEVARLDDAADRLRAERIRVGRMRALFEPAIDALPELGIIALLGVGAWQVSTDAVTTGELVQSMALFSILALPMRIVGFFLEEVPKSVVSLDRVDSVIDEPGPVREDTTHAALPAGPLAVRFDDVRFTYTTEPILHDLRFEVAAGETVALVGSTGSGKSTVCQLAVGLMPPTGGAITVGGVDLATVATDVQYDAMALVFQESFLFATSVRENVTMGREAVADAHLDRVAAMVKADGFIGDLPQGWETVVGERGVTLSGGQRQRIALARALVRRPRVLLLDDATSAVDPRIEQQILEELRSGLDATVLIVAHRLSTIQLADRVLYLDDGRIAGAGSHADLLRLSSYRALVRAYEQEAVH